MTTTIMRIHTNQFLAMSVFALAVLIAAPAAFAQTGVDYGLTTNGTTYVATTTGSGTSSSGTTTGGGTTSTASTGSGSTTTGGGSSVGLPNTGSSATGGQQAASPGLPNTGAGGNAMAVWMTTLALAAFVVGSLASFLSGRRITRS